MRNRSLALVAALAPVVGACTAQVSSSGRFVQAGAPLPAEPVHRESSASVHASLSVEVSFYGIPLGGSDDVVFVLDRSGSMNLASAGVSGRALGMSKGESALASIGGSLINGAAGSPLPSKLEAAKAELLRTLHSMPNGTRVGVVFFDTTVQTPNHSLITLSPATRAQIETFVAAIQPGGSTAARPAMDAAYAMGASRIVLLSDGLANSGGGADSVLASAEPHIRNGLRIDTVGVGLDQDDALLQSLARTSGGMAVMR